MREMTVALRSVPAIDGAAGWMDALVIARAASIVLAPVRRGFPVAVDRA